jgi:hypothetical protein
MDFDGRHFGSFRHNRVSIPIHSSQGRFGDFDRSQLADRLDRLAEVRGAVVARGRALIANSGYPDREIVRHISRLLAEHLQH